MGAILDAVMNGTNYRLTQFSQSSVDALENRIFMKKGKPFVKCLVRDKDIQVKPEEAVRQLYIEKLMTEYGYPKERMELERQIHFGRETQRGKGRQHGRCRLAD